MFFHHHYHSKNIRRFFFFLIFLFCSLQIDRSFGHNLVSTHPSKISLVIVPTVPASLNSSLSKVIHAKSINPFISAAAIVVNRASFLNQHWNIVSSGSSLYFSKCSQKRRAVALLMLQLAAHSSNTRSNGTWKLIVWYYSMRLKRKEMVWACWQALVCLLIQLSILPSAWVGIVDVDYLEVAALNPKRIRENDGVELIRFDDGRWQ